MTYVLDTNIILHDPDVIFKLGKNNKIVVPIFCLEEIDKFKHEASERGRNARHFARLLDNIRKNFGKLSHGVKLENGGLLQVAVRSRDPNKNMDENILQVAKEFNDAIFLTRDCNLRVRADAWGVVSETYEKEDSIASVDEAYTGVVEVPVHREILEDFYNSGEVWFDNPDGLGVNVPPNCFVVLVDEDNPMSTAMGVYTKDLKTVLNLDVLGEVYGVQPRNKEQFFALHALLADNIKLVTLTGEAGTGKTLLALAAAMKLTFDDVAYNKICVSRPVVPLGKDIGYLPGSMEEKLHPWMQPIYDNFEFIVSNSDTEQDDWRNLIDSNLIQIEPLTYIRGRSLPFNFMIVDEAQNLTPHEVKTIITRAGTDTKIVLTGDPNQIDSPYIDSTNNGLSVTVEKFKNEDIAAHVTLVKGERSKLAETAAKLFK